MADVNRIDLTRLIHDTDLEEPLCLYIYGHDGYHSGGQWFRRVPEYPREEIPAAAAKLLAENAVKNGFEVRITNGADFLVFHAQRGKVIYPADWTAFWKTVLGA